MSDFGTWIRATWPETMKASRLSERTNDLANLAAQLEEELVAHSCTGMCYEGYQYEVQVCKRDATLKACREFQEKCESWAQEKVR